MLAGDSLHHGPRAIRGSIVYHGHIEGQPGVLLEDGFHGLLYSGSTVEARDDDGELIHAISLG
jgi:hypothetical protein